MRHAHDMPFGAAVTDGGVRFRLWAPAARTVELGLDAAGGTAWRALEPVDDGWLERLEPEARAGSRYRFRIDGVLVVPDPASRGQAADVEGPSVVIDPRDYAWQDRDWRGRPWEEAVLYELHVGTFSPAGTFDGVRERLPHLADLGITAVELMPIADFPGRRNWGYDGVLPYAPDTAYGSPDDLKRLVEAAHAHGLMLILDVVYNHFGPLGNYLHAYVPQFFTDRFETPWGAAIDFSRRDVRDFFVHNALYWLEEYRCDGLRLDAVHAIIDDSSPHILDELADTVRARFDGERHVHLVLENERNEARWLERRPDGTPRRYTAQWNDDVHHCLHVLAAGERDAYYEDYADRPVDLLARCLAEGFAWQGEPFRHRDGERRGEPSAHLPPGAFVAFLQNHDQVGNRAFGERLSALAAPEVLAALGAVLLLCPSPPLLFMGEEWAAPEPFLFFCDFHDELADAVREGRRNEFAKFPAFRDEETRARIPDPNAESTFARSRLDWSRAEEGEHAARRAQYRELLHLRRRDLVPRLAGARARTVQRFGDGGLCATWTLGDGSGLTLLANLAPAPAIAVPVEPNGRLLHATPQGTELMLARRKLPPWSVAWFIG
jgi:malto-oligosyltrehalose trehalohydrolase